MKSCWTVYSNSLITHVSFGVPLSRLNPANCLLPTWDFKWFKLQGDKGKSAPNFNLLLNTEIKSNSSYTLNGAAPTINQNDLNGRNSVEINNRGLTGNAWKGISFISSKKEFKRGDTIVIRLPIYIYSDVPVDNGIHLALKSSKLGIQSLGISPSTAI